MSKPMDKPATPLPWKADQEPGDEWYFGHGDQIVIRPVGGATWDCVMVGGGDSESQRSNAAYIVHACNAYPHLTAINAINAELVSVLEEAIYWDGRDAEGVDAVWLVRANAALARAKENSNG